MEQLPKEQCNISSSGNIIPRSLADNLVELRTKVLEACERVNRSYEPTAEFFRDVDEVAELVAKRISELTSTGVKNIDSITGLATSIGSYIVKLSYMGVHLKIDEYESFESSDASLRLFYKLVDWQQVNAAGISVLHRVVVVNYIRGLKLLLERNVNVNQRSIPQGLTPLHCARSPECVELLLKHGADPNIKNNNNETLLLQIYKGTRVYNNGEETMVELLFKAGANVMDTVDFFFSRSVYESHAKYDNLRKMLLDAGTKSFQELADMSRQKPIPLPETHPLYKCVKEIELICGQKILHVPLFDFLVKDKRHLSSYLKNTEVMQKLNELIVGRKKLRPFPKYKRFLINNFKAAKRRLYLEKEATVQLSSIMRLPSDHLVIEKIIFSLETEDLRNLCKI